MVRTFSRFYKKDLQKFFKNIIPLNIEAKIVLENPITGTYDYLLLPNTVAYLKDVQDFVKGLKVHCKTESRVVVVYFNFMWKPLLQAAVHLGLREKDLKEPNWLSSEDIRNIFTLEGFEEIKRGKRLLLPVNIGPISTFINQFIAQLPFINSFCVTTFQIFKQATPPKDYSVSIIVPARNEEGTITNIISKIPGMGTATEIIFIEGHSKDNTYNAIKEEINRNKRSISAQVYKQKGAGKADAVHLGCSKAKNDIIMILDADLTVSPEELPKFYRALANGKGEFINGSRLVYPLESQAMRTLNYLGNKIFSILFTFILGQHIKDTLCGTKAFFRKDYIQFKKNLKTFGNFDPFGDYILLFGASKLNLKIVEIPIRYKDRVYGATNISRFTHGLLLLKMVIFAALKIKFV